MPKKGKVLGVGISDRPKWAKGTPYQRKVYYTWVGMLRRCYDKRDSGYSTYGAIGVYVCDEWLRFSTFSKDITHLVGYASWKAQPLGSYGYALDKDIIGGIVGMRCYSPRTCCFIPTRLNNLERLNRCGNPGRSKKANKSRAISEGQKCYYIDPKGDKSEEFYGYREMARHLYGDDSHHSSVKTWCKGRNNHTCIRGRLKGYKFYDVG